MMMADAEKVIKALELCASGCDDNGCVYLEEQNNRGGLAVCRCVDLMARDALELLKAYAKTEEQKQAERKQKRREWQAKYRESHKEHARQTLKEWRKNNPDKVKAQKARYRERQRMKKDGDGE